MGWMCSALHEVKTKVWNYHSALICEHKNLNNSKLVALLWGLVWRSG